MRAGSALPVLGTVERWRSCWQGSRQGSVKCRCRHRSLSATGVHRARSHRQRRCGTGYCDNFGLPAVNQGSYRAAHRVNLRRHRRRASCSCSERIRCARPVGRHSSMDSPHFCGSSIDRSSRTCRSTSPPGLPCAASPPSFERCADGHQQRKGRPRRGSQRRRRSNSEWGMGDEVADAGVLVTPRNETFAITRSPIPPGASPYPRSPFPHVRSLRDAGTRGIRDPFLIVRTPNRAPTFGSATSPSGRALRTCPQSRQRPRACGAGRLHLLTRYYSARYPCRP